MKVLVTGATGQVGCRLVRQLLAANHEVRGTAWTEAPPVELERVAGLELDLRKGELTDKAFVQAAVDGVDGRVHASANPAARDARSPNTRVRPTVAPRSSAICTGCLTTLHALHRIPLNQVVDKRCGRI